MNKDNQIMSLLSDIDEELIDDILEEPIFLEKTANPIKADKKSIFAKFALPVAACLVVAAVSVGVLIFGGRNLPTVSQTTETSAVTTPANTSEVTTPANTFTEVSQEQAECEALVADELDVFQRMGCTYSCGYIDLNFDGTEEIVLYPDTGLGSVFFFEKTEQGCKKAGTIDIESLYALNSFENLRLYDKDGEKYYYYYYFNEPQNYYEEKGIAKLQLDEKGITTESLLSYGAYLKEHPDDELIDLLTYYYKIGESDVSYDELSALWSEYEGVPPIEIEDYWYNGTVSLENAPLLSDLIKENALPNIDGSFTTGGRRDSYNFNYEGTIPKVILCQKDCGENKISLLGYKVRTDNAYDENGIAIHRLMLVLSDKNGNLLDVEKVTMPTSSIYEDCVFPINYTDDSLEAVDFGENQVIFYRCISEDDIFQRGNLFAVKENRILPCRYFNPDDEYSQSYTPVLSALYTVETDPLINAVTDKVTNKTLRFHFSEAEGYVPYTIDLNEDESLELNISEYTPVEDADIPIVPESGLDYRGKAQYALENAVPKVLFAQKTITAGDSVYTLCLIGENAYAVSTEYYPEKLMYCTDLRTAIFKDLKYLGSVRQPQYPTSVYAINPEDYEEKMVEGYYCQEYDALILIKDNPAFDNAHGKNCFAAVYKDSLFPDLVGSTDNLSENTPKWVHTVGDESLYSSIEVKGNTVICGYYVYTINFGDNFGVLDDYSVRWRDDPPTRSTD